MPKKQYLGLKSGARLDQNGYGHCKGTQYQKHQTHDATILHAHAKPVRIEFLERTRDTTSLSRSSMAHRLSRVVR
jgi:hypothetical protein